MHDAVTRPTPPSDATAWPRRQTHAVQIGGVTVGGGKPVAVDFALVCATHRKLPQEMQEGRFREDLYYRINGLTLQLPALRARSDFDELVARQLRRLVPGHSILIAPELMVCLRRYAWPGNLRQLANALRTACALLDEQETVIAWHHMPDDLAQALAADSSNLAAQARRHTLAKPEKQIKGQAGHAGR